MAPLNGFNSIKYLAQTYILTLSSYEISILIISEADNVGCYVQFRLRMTRLNGF